MSVPAASPNLRRYTTALDGFEAVLRSVPAGAWNNPSPCEDWRTIDVAGHVIGGLGMVTHLVTTGQMPPELLTTQEAVGDDPMAAFAAARAALERSLAAPGAMNKVVESPFGTMPVDPALGIFVLEVLTHTWDLARGAGVDVRLDPELVRVCGESIRPMDEMIRVEGVFGPKVEAPPGADEQTELMAFLGRPV
jgi:uncharacterized protein (TIGR03086 family)